MRANPPHRNKEKKNLGEEPSSFPRSTPIVVVLGVSSSLTFPSAHSLPRVIRQLTWPTSFNSLLLDRHLSTTFNHPHIHSSELAHPLLTCALYRSCLANADPQALLPSNIIQVSQ
ncbi:hypothetical protein M427DRAFT_398529 [Gonapodya prolifera JEL478]|uniref:Uncharacterized protein n=1 Tax=Gonapodya prolifera (strain JEL478) TaxID=1344416 RepID=A0A139A6A7_GONPJ|nr:hypothetical protein M427DRAFT_398529 [Gonapodya prolifera JEL478]|eukprot:KXS12291.1 hypothetical protein M427DRAFT_398529 [Gonapodya prolifera JEL478]